MSSHPQPYDFVRFNYLRLVNNIVTNRYHTVILGRAGSGKSYIIRILVEQLPAGSVLVTSPTAMTALGLDTGTNHQAFYLPPTVILPCRKVQVNDEMEDKLRRITTWILDESSMVRSDVFDGIDRVLRLVRKDPRPFGGVRVILVGDLFQLPPVATQIDSECIRKFQPTFGYEGTSLLTSNAWRNIEPEVQVFELMGSFRQRGNESGFLALLDRARRGIPEAQDLASLNSRRIFANPSGVPLLTARKVDRDEFNQACLRELHGEAVTREPIVHWDCGSYQDQRLLAACPGYQRLHLKLGMKVQFNRNHPDGFWINGSTGTLVQIGLSVDGVPDQVVVKIEPSGDTVRVEPDYHPIYYPWYDPSSGNGDTPVIASVLQFPFGVGYASTIHACQGKTLDQAVIHLGEGAFEAGMLYVALSRVRTFQGLWLTKAARKSDFFAPVEALNFYSRMASRIVPVYPD